MENRLANLMKNYARMCGNQTGCNGCPINRIKGNIHCRDFILKNGNRVAYEIEKWANEHPEKTLLSDFLEKYPNPPRLENGNLMICPFDLGYTKDNKCYGRDCTECWSRPLE